jgi:hypothetical protein
MLLERSRAVKRRRRKATMTDDQWMLYLASRRKERRLSVEEALGLLVAAIRADRRP